jgi:hypothetical protein
MIKYIDFGMGILLKDSKLKATGYKQRGRGFSVGPIMVGWFKSLSDRLIHGKFSMKGKNSMNYGPLP